MPRTIAQIVKAAQEGGAHNLTPAEFAVLQRLERQKADKAAAAAAASVDPGPATILRRSKGGRGWYTRQEMADIMGVHPTNFERTYRPLVNVNDIDEEMLPGKTKPIVWYRGRGVIDAFVKSKMPKRGDDLDEFADADSPALERYRSLKADMAALDLEERYDRLVPLDDVKHVVGVLTNAIRALGERAQRKYGRELGVMFSEALDGAEMMLEQKYGGTQENQTGDAGHDQVGAGPVAVPDAADDASIRGGGDDPADGAAQGVPLQV